MYRSVLQTPEISELQIVTANWKVGESFQNTQVVCLFFISVHCIHIPIDLAWDKTVRKPLQLFYCNCHSNHDSLIGVLSPRNSYRGDKVMDRSCVSKWGSVRLSRFDFWAWYSQQPLSLLLFVLTRTPPPLPFVILIILFNIWILSQFVCPF